MATPAMPRSRFATVNDRRVHSLDGGNGNAPALVCVHGDTSSAHAFNAWARHVRDRFHVLAVDVRGHGESAWSPTGAYQYSDQVADLSGCVDQLAEGPFALVETSMGGIIGMAYAAEHPERLRRLVINDIGPDAEMGSCGIGSWGSWGGRRPRRAGDVTVTGATDGATPPEGVRVVRSRADGRSATGFLPENCLQRPTAGAKVDGTNLAFLLGRAVGCWRPCRPAIGS